MKLNVLIVSDQIRGIDGTGGLGDVATGLAKALAKRDDLEIRLLMPGYEKISEKNLERRFENVVLESLPVPLGSSVVNVSVAKVVLPVFSKQEPQVICYLLREPGTFAKRENSGRQAVLLARGAISFCSQCEEFRPDVIHCNDWHSALIPVYLNTVYRNDPYLNRIATLYTTHNNTGGAYQGLKPMQEVQPLAGLPVECYAPGTTRSVEFFGQFNHAKGGIGFSDLVNTVSVTYARELRSAVFGGGLNPVVEDRGGEVCGIVNGIDAEEWNPETDHFLPVAARFSVRESPQEIRRKKNLLRSELRAWQDPDGDTPYSRITDDSILIGVVTRISDQKMPILLPMPEDTGFSYEIASPIERICERATQIGAPVQWVFLGNADPNDRKGLAYAARLKSLAKDRADDIAFYDGFSIGLSHIMYAASELFVVPSSFEPCGLTQLTAMRYGSIPIVRDVGGLRDTVIDENSGFEANGFKFLERDDSVENWRHQSEVPWATELLYQTLVRALSVRSNNERWNQLIVNGLKRDSSWTIPASQYRRLYDEAVRHRLGQSFNRPNSVPDLFRQVKALKQEIERLLKVPQSAFTNLQKFVDGSFGPYGLTSVFRAELLYLQDCGYLSKCDLNHIPENGENLSKHLWITPAGLEFVSLRMALQEAATTV